jgi:hypothetical protein
MSKSRKPGAAIDRARPIDRQNAHEIQGFGHVTRIPIALSQNIAAQSVENDLLVSDIIRTNEKQAWFVSEHLVDVPLVRAD